jgi:hypothetical protein
MILKQADTTNGRPQLLLIEVRHAALAPEEFFDRVLADIRKYSQRDTFADDVCNVGMQIRHTE